MEKKVTPFLLEIKIPDQLGDDLIHTSKVQFQER